MRLEVEKLGDDRIKKFPRCRTKSCNKKVGFLVGTSFSQTEAKQRDFLMVKSGIVGNPPNYQKAGQNDVMKDSTV